MNTTKSFKSQTIGYYFAINELPSPADDSLPEAAIAAADAIHERAHELLSQRLPQHALWNEPDEHEPELSHPRFEVCELCLLNEDIGGLSGYGFWLYSDQRVANPTLRALKTEIADAYTEAAQSLGGTCRFLQVDCHVTEELVTVNTINLADDSALDDLTTAQRDHLEQCTLLDAAQRSLMINHLRQGAEVIVFKQTEMVDAPDYAVAPVDQADFWIGCWHSQADAEAGARALGLQVTSRD